MACGRTTPQPPQAREEARFPHDLHLPPALAWSGVDGPGVCLECHRSSTGSPTQLIRPGADDHSPCDREQCHGAAFHSPPGPLCLICHEPPVEPLPTTAVRPYPPVQGMKHLASDFSHRLHLDAGRMERAVGFHVSCTDCHAWADAGHLAVPDHSTCARCHASEATREKMPVMNDCGRCHHQRNDAPTRTRQLIVGDLRFSHTSHRLDRQSRPIACVECHQRAADVATFGNHDVPPTSACVGCHDDAKRVKPAAQMKVCETCHQGKRSGLSSLAPRSHLPREEMPDNHTIAFREDHTREARANPEQCAACHTFMSGATRDTCDQCHQAMRPRSHTVTWREFEHGPSAAVDQDSCATCHGADFCIACHSRPPRSHFPLSAFRMGDHGVPAALDVRACLTCHDPSTGFCTESGCHSPAMGGLPR